MIVCVEVLVIFQPFTYFINKKLIQDSLISTLCDLRKSTEERAAAAKGGGIDVVKMKFGAKLRIQSIRFLFPATYPPNVPKAYNSTRYFEYVYYFRIISLGICYMAN